MDAVSFQAFRVTRVFKDAGLVIFTLLAMAAVPAAFFTVYFVRMYQTRVEAPITAVTWSCVVVAEFGKGKGRKVSREFMPCDSAEERNVQNLQLMSRNERPAGQSLMNSSRVLPVADLTILMPFQDETIERTIRLFWPSDMRWAEQSSIPVRRLEFRDQDIEIIPDWTYALRPVTAFVFFVIFAGVLLLGYFLNAALTKSSHDAPHA